MSPFIIAIFVIVTLVFLISLLATFLARNDVNSLLAFIIAVVFGIFTGIVGMKCHRAWVTEHHPINIERNQ
jgi:FtsH-binding integral membrane protein